MSKPETPILVTDMLKKSFGGIQATNGLSLKLYKGKVIGLIGPNGAGKTTAFNLTTGFLKPDEGKITYKGNDITGFSPHKISNLGIVRTWQNLRLFMDMTVLDHVLLARQNQPGESLLLAIIKPSKVRKVQKSDLERSLQILQLLGLQDKRHVYAEDLSYAEQKLLSLARIIAMEADVLLLDEPMSGLDGNSLEMAKRLVHDLAVKEGKAICLIEHNVDFVADACDRILFLDQGQVIAEGTPQEIMANEHLTKIYFGE
ncbi:MAG: branched-chain amino acid transporter permease [Bacilli bacterium]|nr:branched-chain amino acid transporter permease [Bacilli bacterium]